MRSIGAASRALEIMLLRVTEPKKVMFGKMLMEHGTVVEKIAKSRMEIDQARLLVLSAALQVWRIFTLFFILGTLFLKICLRWSDFAFRLTWFELRAR